jgi:putative MATE family efflux protein
MKDEKDILDDDRVGRLLFKLALPAFVGMFVMSLYNIVNTIFIGRFVGPLGIAGLSIVFPIQMISMGIGHLMGMGGASLMSISFGAGNISRAEHALGNAVTCTFIASFILMAFGLAKMDFCLTVLGASETILPYARDYMRIIMVGMFFQTFAMALNSLIRAEGNARVPMTGMLAGAILNIILDAIFIIHLKMGVTGAALGTVIAQMISVSYFMWYYISDKSRLKFHIKYFIIDWKILKTILSIGVSAFVMMVAGSVSALFINRLCLFYGGDMAVSAYGIINRIVMFALMPGIVISQGLQPIIGFNYGAGRFRRILKALKFSLMAATAFCVVAFIFLELFPHIFIGVFTDDAELIALTSYAIRRILATAYLIGFIIIGSTIFQAIGKPIQAFVTSTARSTLFLIPLILILPRFIEMDGIWWSFPVAEILAFCLTMTLFTRQVMAFRRTDLKEKSG